MTEHDFDLLLQEEISSLPPVDQLTEAVNPWRRSMNRILWGLALVTVTLNFLNLDSILPAIGMLLMLLGFRALRRENCWFRAGYLLSILRTLWLLAHLFWGATIYSSSSRISEWMLLGTYFMVVVGFFHLVCLRNGIRAVQKKAGLEPHSGSANALLFFYALMSLLAFINFEGFAVWFLLIAYFFILRGLWKLSKELEDAGYAITPAPVRVTDRVASVCYALVITLLLAAGYLFFNQYPMEWTPAEPQSTAVDEVRTELLELGFPEYVLNDLTEEELLACEGAAKIFVDTEELPVSDGYEVYEERSDGIYIHTDYKARELLVTAVVVEPSEPEQNWMIFHHFLWTSDPGYRGTEALQLWPTYRNSDGWVSADRFSGRVLYDEGDTTYTAPFYRLDEISYTYNGFFGSNFCRDIVAIFSLPKDGENCRGYVCYGVQMAEEGWLVNSWCNYYYQQTFLQYPVVTAEDVLLSGNFSYSHAIKANQTAIQLISQDDGSYRVNN